MHSQIEISESKSKNEIPNDINYPEFIEKKIRKFIDGSEDTDVEDKKMKIEGPERIMKERLRGLNYSSNSPLLNQTVYYVLSYVKLQPQEFKNHYVDTFITECIHAYEGENGMTCAVGALERIIFSLQAAIVFYGIEKNSDYETILDIINANPNVLVKEYILDWYKLHSPIKKKSEELNSIEKKSEEEITKFLLLTPEKKQENLIEYIKTKFPENQFPKQHTQKWLDKHVIEYVEAIGLESDDFAYGGRRKTKKLRKITKTSKQRKTIKKKHKLKKLNK